jgi:carbonic anhydrase
MNGVICFTHRPTNPIVPRTSYSELLESMLTRGHLFNYPGSLTTPGCTEFVDWWVIDKPLKIATEDLTRLQEHFKEFAIYADGKNARPVQPLNGRTITAYTL